MSRQRSNPGLRCNLAPARQGRRRLVAGICIALAAPMLCVPRRAHAKAEPRSLRFEHTHTGERLALVYAVGDQYVSGALDLIRYFLRDFRNGATHTIDPGLLDQLHLLAASTATQVPFQVISGYRSPATNAMLRERSEEVAKKSFHMSGMAIDIRLPDVDLDRLHAAALSLGRGGVGYYPYSNFVHVDVGPVRTWYG
jgi:uncharacterized protein YcbK (DUF882 family)